MSNNQSLSSSSIQEQEQNQDEPEVLTHKEKCKDNACKMTHLENQLKTQDNEILNYKKRVAELEAELANAQKFKAQHLKESEEVEAVKQLSEETLTKAKSLLFDKTKVIKNQELQIEALNQQISSLKDVVTITKDLLEIRNLEVKQLETKIECMEGRINAEKERQDLMHKKLENMIRYNGELKREYETQLCLFSALRERYNERELARGVINELGAAGRSEEQAPSTSQNSSGGKTDGDNNDTDTK